MWQGEYGLISESLPGNTCTTRGPTAANKIADTAYMYRLLLICPTNTTQQQIAAVITPDIMSRFLRTSLNLNMVSSDGIYHLVDIPYRLFHILIGERKQCFIPRSVLRALFVIDQLSPLILVESRVW